MNAKRLLDISEAAEMLQYSAAKVRQMVIGDQTLAAVHENYRGSRAPFRLGGLRVFDVDEMGAITDVMGKKPAGWLRFEFAEVVRVLSERAHVEANAVLLSDLIQPALVAAVGASGGVEPDKAGPPPLTTGDIAFCFAGLRYKTEKEWKTLIGKGRGWVERCLVQPGTRGRGGAPKLWNPVCIDAALIRDGHVKPNNVRAKFQTQPLLKPWLDEWKTYEADNLSAD